MQRYEKKKEKKKKRKEKEALMLWVCGYNHAIHLANNSV
jgi:hypothetical protein